MKKILTILFVLLGCNITLHAEEVVADSAMNQIFLVSAQDTLIYYPAGAYGAVPEAYFKADQSATDSIKMTAQIAFTDCQLHYIWVPADCGITATSVFVVGLLVNETGATYEVRYAQVTPQAIDPDMAKPAAQKLIRNGQVIILRNGVSHTIMGLKL